LLKVSADESTERSITKERQYVAVECSSVSHARRWTVGRSRQPPGFGELPNCLTASVSIDDHTLAVFSCKLGERMGRFAFWIERSDADLPSTHSYANLISAGTPAADRAES
jgi:hypothetical protein